MFSGVRRREAGSRVSERPVNLAETLRDRERGAQTAAEDAPLVPSEDRTLKRLVLAWGPAALWAAVLFLLSEIRSVPSLSGFLANDKLVHGGLYAIMGGFLALGAHISRSKRLWLALLVGYLYGAVDEWHQMFVPRRVPSLSDWAADVVGVTLGFVLVLMVLRLRSWGKNTVEEEGR